MTDDIDRYRKNVSEIYIHVYTHAHTYIFMYKRERKLSSSYSHLMIHDKQKKTVQYSVDLKFMGFFLVLSINAFSLLFRFRLKAT